MSGGLLIPLAIVGYCIMGGIVLGIINAVLDDDGIDLEPRFFGTIFWPLAIVILLGAAGMFASATLTRKVMRRLNEARSSSEGER